MEKLAVLSRFTQAKEMLLDHNAPETISPINAFDFPLDDRKEMFEIAKSAWEQVFDPNSLTNLLSANPPEIEENERLYVKSVRNHGIILRGAYKFIDARHRSPSSLANLVRKMGKFNDFYYTSEHSEYRSSLLNSMPIDTTLDFEPASDESFQQAFNTALTNIQIRASSINLLVPELHELRKELRHVMNIYQLGIVLRDDPSKAGTFKHIKSLSNALGRVHDVFTEKAHKGELDYETAEVEIDQALNTRLLVLTQSFQI